MGCDIHAYVEYTDSSDQAGRRYWRCLIRNAGSRDYDLFGILAGVRSARAPVVPLRGLPDIADLSWEVLREAFLRISDNPANAGREGFCTLADAKQRGCQVLDYHGIPHAEHPDWHSASWLTADELALCIGTYMIDVREQYDIEWDGILAAMKAIDERGARSRLVFWFDN